MTFPEKNDQALNVYILKNVLSQFKLPFKLPGHCPWLVKSYEKENLRRFARFGTDRTVNKTWKTPMEQCSFQ